MIRPILKFKNNGNRSKGSGVAAVESRGMFLTLFLTDAAQPEPLVYQKLQIIDPERPSLGAMPSSFVFKSRCNVQIKVRLFIFKQNVAAIRCNG